MLLTDVLFGILEGVGNNNNKNRVHVCARHQTNGIQTFCRLAFVRTWLPVTGIAERYFFHQISPGASVPMRCDGMPASGTSTKCNRDDTPPPMRVDCSWALAPSSAVVGWRERESSPTNFSPTESPTKGAVVVGKMERWGSSSDPTEPDVRVGVSTRRRFHVSRSTYLLL